MNIVRDFEVADETAFRAAIRTWLKSNFPPGLRGKSAMDYQTDPAVVAADADYELWLRRVGEAGLGTPTWPKEYGGAGLSSGRARILAQEMARLGAFNPVGGMGLMMFGPTLLEYGNEEQKRRHIPPIARGEIRWCQGFSEPCAGSDLAALQTKCEDKGDHWLVNGQKIWTSGAQYADWCFCLVRTDTTRKQEGISFLLIDMRTPGIEVRPILLISGVSPFCELFLTDVRVPKENLVGPVNGGWTIGKRLLQHERQGLSGRAARGAAIDLADLARRYVGTDAQGHIDDLDLRSRLIDHSIRARAVAQTQQRAAAEARTGEGPSAASSVLKNAGSKISQQRHELILEIMGVQGLGWGGDGFDREELAAVRAWLAGKAFSIYGGSYEIQNNVIAKRILGLLDHQ